MSGGGKTIRQAIAIALEGLNGDLLEWVVLTQQKKALRSHIKSWVHDYARSRGVILSDSDIESELKEIISELRSGVPLASVARSEK
jgi:ribosomal protein S15P/S13E